MDGSPRGVQSAPQIVYVLEALDGPRLFADATPHQEARVSATVDAEDDPPVVFPLRFELVWRWLHHGGAPALELANVTGSQPRVAA